MLRNLNDLRGSAIQAADGAIGHVRDFYIDDEAWIIRYLVVDTGHWLSSRKVLISPLSIQHMDWVGKKLSLTITMEQVQNSPDIDTDKPVSRQHEIDFLGYYTYPLYWGGAGVWDDEARSESVMPEFVSTPAVVQPESDIKLDTIPASPLHDDPHLRSSNIMLSYFIHARDGEIGHVQSLLIDDHTWAVQYLVVNTSNWWLGHQVLIAPEWVTNISWMDVSLEVTRQQVKDAPPYDPAIKVDRAQEASIYKHYGNMAYWAKDPPLDVPRAAAPR